MRACEAKSAGRRSSLPRGVGAGRGIAPVRVEGIGHADRSHGMERIIYPISYAVGKGIMPESPPKRRKAGLDPASPVPIPGIAIPASSISDALVRGRP
jgi:hypothetical protein